MLGNLVCITVYFTVLIPIREISVLACCILLEVLVLYRALLYTVVNYIELLYSQKAIIYYKK